MNTITKNSPVNTTVGFDIVILGAIDELDNKNT